MVADVGLATKPRLNIKDQRFDSKMTYLPLRLTAQDVAAGQS